MASPHSLKDALRAAKGKDAEVHFLRLMAVHHRAGAEMAQAADRRGGHGRDQKSGGGMVLGQQAEIRLMAGMLRERVVTA
ncbi:DUF305 domain-containing protein [Streptomyces sp. NPDC051286]|uniref:DUF305 domain-containing protein n=1 Tax=Streptomyces sp. NPDC051286 TaxID=3365647 RepID=UPI00379AE98D